MAWIWGLWAWGQRFGNRLIKRTFGDAACKFQTEGFGAHVVGRRSRGSCFGVGIAIRTFASKCRVAHEGLRIKNKAGGACKLSAYTHERGSVTARVHLM